MADRLLVHVAVRGQSGARLARRGAPRWREDKAAQRPEMPDSPDLKLQGLLGISWADTLILQVYPVLHPHSVSPNPTLAPDH